MMLTGIIDGPRYDKMGLFENHYICLRQNLGALRPLIWVMGVLIIGHNEKKDPPSLVDII